MSLSDALFGKGKVKNSKIGDPFPIEEWEAERGSIKKTVVLYPPEWAVDHKPVTVVLYRTGMGKWQEPRVNWKPITEREMKLFKGRDVLFGSEYREIIENRDSDEG